MSEDNSSQTQTGMERMWANLSPEERATRSKAMADGRKKAKAKRERQSKLKATRRRSNGSSTIDDTLELTKLAASLLELAGSRDQVDHLLDIAELVKGGA
jgi:hypothetical protein